MDVPLSQLSEEKQRRTKHPIGSSIGGFVIVLVLAVAVFAVLMFAGLGALLAALAVALLLLPFGADTRLAGWLVASALPVAFAAVTVLNAGTPTCMPIDDPHLLDGCAFAYDARWLIAAGALVVVGMLILLVAIRRRPSDLPRSPA
jgi:hypothetical protein